MARSIKVFVGGPFSSAVRRDGEPTQFDDSLRKSIDKIHEIVLASGACLLSAHNEEKYGVNSDLSNIVTRDFRWLTECDLFVAVLPLNALGIPYRSDGTFVECGIAIGLGKSVVLLIEWIGHPEQSEFIKHLDHLSGVSLLRWDKSTAVPSSALATILAMQSGI